MIGPLAFLSPWVLAGLLLLPVLWFLLRVTPPAPRRMEFPAARFLAGLREEDRTSSRTPWWILLMRLLAAALIVIALARPVLHPAASLSGSGPVRIVVDNGWEAARNWPWTMQAADDIAQRAARENRTLYIMTTAPEPGSSKPLMNGPLTSGQAEAALRALTPRPWPADYTAGDSLLAATRAVAGIHSFFLSHGVRDMGDSEQLLKDLEAQGDLTFMHPDPAHLPLLLRKLSNPGADIEAYIDAPPSIANGVPVSVEALGLQGKILDIEQVRLDAHNLPNKVKLDMPAPLRGQVARIDLASRAGAGGVLLYDDQLGRKSVGIVSAVKAAQATPLVDASFYLDRAMSTYADIQSGPLPELLKAKPAVLILPDIGTLQPAELNALETWVKNGGMLLRFAGPNMSQGTPALIPVPLRSGGRALNGAMTWEKPLHLASFAKTSPYFGLDVPADVTVKQQLLAEPSEGLDKKTWAALEDGTPLITASALGRGMLVMVHTTATPAWSDLALSGLFVQILHRTINMAGLSAQPSAPASGTLQPLSMLDGFGALVAPDATVQPITPDHAANQPIDSRHPPGIYGRPGVSRALNIGEQAATLTGFDDLPSGIEDIVMGQDSAHERDMMPLFLAAALLLFMADWLAMIVLQAGWRFRMAGFGLIAALCFMHPAACLAQDADAIKYAGNIYLAYIKSGDAAVDSTTQSGLQNLVQVLNDRTSVEPAGVVAIDPEHDDLSFFPLIYWRVAGTAAPLSPGALRRVQDYLDHGGTILFDTADQANEAHQGANGAALQSIAGALNIPPLVPLPSGHVLMHSFYLLRNAPGRYDDGTIWIEDQSASGRDNVSSVIVGSNDWAGEWAGLGNRNDQSSGSGDQADISMRFGVNLVMYALTGNYKSDQVHLQQIMERLGQ